MSEHSAARDLGASGRAGGLDRSTVHHGDARSHEGTANASNEESKPMASERPSVLIVEDSLSLGAVYRAYLREEPYEVAHVSDGAGAMERIKTKPPDALLLDLQLPDMDMAQDLSLIHI